MTEIFTTRDQELKETASTALLAYLRKSNPAPRDRQQAIIAQAVYASATGLLRTQVAQDALHYTMAAQLAPGTPQLADYVERSMPHMPMSRVLRDGTGDAVTPHKPAIAKPALT